MVIGSTLSYFDMFEIFEKFEIFLSHLEGDQQGGG
jgi:hypothetical protein